MPEVQKEFMTEVGPKLRAPVLLVRALPIPHSCRGSSSGPKGFHGVGKPAQYWDAFSPNPVGTIVFPPHTLVLWGPFLTYPTGTLRKAFSCG